MGSIKIRPAKKTDSKAILNLILELSKFEKLNPPDVLASKRLIKDAFSKNSPFKILLAESNSLIVGYIFYFFTYSSFLASKTLYLEDIFVLESFRNIGIGKLFFKELIKIAKRNKCGRIEWVVLDWNTNAISFYNSLGAKPLEDWKTYRLILS